MSFIKNASSPIILLTCLCILALSACKQTLPPSLDGEVALTFDGTIDNEPILIEAGKEGMQLNADYLRDGVGIDNYIGEFSPLSCKGCAGSLRLTLRGKVLPALSSPAEPVSDLATGTYDFVGGTQNSADPKAFRFRAISSGTHPMQHEWIMDGDTIHGQDAPFRRFSKTGHQPVILRTTDAQGCMSETEYRVPSGNGFCGDPFRFEYQKMGSGKVHFHAPTGLEPDDIQAVTWNFGDGGFVVSEIQPTYTYARPGIYRVKVVIVDKNGCLHCDFQNVYSEPGQSCESSILALPVAPDGEPGKITVQWWDGAGKAFSSDHIQGQPSSSYFEILSSEPYDADPDGTPTWRIEARLRCTLFASDGSGETMEMVSNKMIFALGIEE
ncbi:MAG: PKD domain-containing protein [Bacteroidia bacterium]